MAGQAEGLKSGILTSMDPDEDAKRRAEEHLRAVRQIRRHMLLMREAYLSGYLRGFYPNGLPIEGSLFEKMMGDDDV